MHIAQTNNDIGRKYPIANQYNGIAIVQSGWPLLAALRSNVINRIIWIHGKCMHETGAYNCLSAITLPSKCIYIQWRGNGWPCECSYDGYKIIKSESAESQLNHENHNLDVKICHFMKRWNDYVPSIGYISSLIVFFHALFSFSLFFSLYLICQRLAVFLFDYAVQYIAWRPCDSLLHVYAMTCVHEDNGLNDD